MAAVVSGNSLGLLNTSLYVLGSQAGTGQAAQGRAAERVYVNAATGNLVVQNTDELVFGRGPDLALPRTYNSLGQFTDDNGDNWLLGFYRKVNGLTGTVNTAGSTVVRTAEDGSQSVYTFDAASGRYASPAGAGAFDTLSYDAAAQSWTWTDGDTRVTERYDAANGGRLTQALDADGNGLTLTYGASGLVTQVADASGETTYLDYTGNNLAQLRTVNASGQTLVRTRYSYDASNRLVQVVTDRSPGDASVADGNAYTVGYTYDGTSRRVATMTQSDGTSVAFTYVQVGGDFRVATITDALGQATSFAYNTAARTTTVTDALGLATVIAYDAAGQLLSVTGPAVNGASQVASYAYDAQGNVTSITDAKGNVVVYQYDANGNRVLERDAAGNTVTRVFGAKNELLAETVYVVPDPDGAGAGQPGTPLTSRYAYDAGDHLRFAVSADGKVTEYRYDGFGQQVAVIRYAGARYDVSALAPTQTLTEAQLVAWLPADKSASVRSDTAYDFRGQVASVTTYKAVAASGAGIVDGTEAVTQYVYDQYGSLLKKVDPRGAATADPGDYTTAYVYDGMGRLLSATDALGVTTVTQYDDANRKTVMTLANGLVSTSTYDAAARLVSVLRSDGTGALGETKYFYDADGRLRRTEDATGVRTHVLYDEAGRKVADIDGDGSLVEYRYDADNNVTRTIHYATAVSAAALASLVDVNGKPTSVALATLRPASSAADRVTYAAYDAANRLVKAVDEAGYVTQTFYDGAGRATDVVRYAAAIATGALADTPAPSAINPAAGAADRLSRVFYDADGKTRGALDGEGYLVEYRYDAAGQLVETIGYATATNAGLRSTGTLAQLVPAAAAGDAHGYTLYNARGQVSATVDAEGYLTEQVYDGEGNKTQTIRYATKVAYTAGASLASLRPAANAQDQTTSATYTALDQLATRTDPDGTVTQYFYDDGGNLTKTVKAAGTTGARSLLAQYDKQGRLIAQLSANGAAQLTGGQTQAQVDAIWAAYATRYTYDAAGRKTGATDADGRKTLYYYDADGQLTHAINALGEVKESVYNALGQVAQTIQYGTRLSAATLAGLSGGLVTSTLTGALAALASPSLDSRTAYAYSTTGKLAQTTDPLGNAVTQAFNAFGEATSRSQALGSGQTLETGYTYDRRGLLLATASDPTGINAQEASVYDAFGRVVQTTDARGNVRTRAYDRLGRVVVTTDALLNARTTTYDAFDRVLTQTDALGKTTTYVYNTANRSVTVTTPEGVATTTIKNRHGETVSVTDGRGNTTAYSYDRDGNLIGVDTPGAGSTSKRYDNAGGVIESTDANGTVTAYAYDAAGRVLTRTVDPGTGHLNLVTTYAYDAKGQTVSVTDAAGAVTQTSYDLKGQVVSVVVDPGTGHLNLTTTYGYDARGRKLTVTEGAGSANPRVTQYAYDKLGRLTQERVDPNGINAATAYVYDANGNVSRKTDALGNVTRYAYDAEDRLVYTVDALGGVTKNEYDAAGRVVRYVAYAGPIALAGLADTPSVADIAARIAAGAADETRSYVYDGDGREIYCIDALGGVTRKTYDANGNLVRKVEYANPIPASTALTQAAVAAALSPSAAGDRVTRTAYDAANRAVFVIDALNYVKETQYDNTGHIVKTVQHTDPVAVSATPSVAEVQAAIAPAVTDVTEASSTPVQSVTLAGQTTTVAANPVQPYTYVAGAQNDVTSPASQAGTLTIQNTSQLQSGDVKNYAWYRSGTSLGTTTGISLDYYHAPVAEYTPTSVWADIYIRNANGTFTYYTTTGTDVGYANYEYDWNYNPGNEYITAGWYQGYQEYGANYSGYHFYNAGGYAGQVNLSYGWNLPANNYRVVVYANDGYAPTPDYGTGYFDFADGTWGSYSATYDVTVGTVVNPTTVSWATSLQPAGTTASLKFRPAGSTGAYTNATMSVSGTNQVANLGAVNAGNYEYVIEYKDSYNRVLKSASGTLTTTAAQTGTTSATFNYTQVTSTAAAGSSISGYITAAEVPTIDYVDATVRDVWGNVVSTARTYPEFEPSYNGRVNLEVGAALADGRYNVSISIHKKDGTVDNRAAFTYDVGATTKLQYTLTWPSSVQPANTTPVFVYRPAGTSYAYLGPAVTVSGGSEQVLIDWATAGSYEYDVQYRDASGKTLQEASGTFVVAASGSATATGNFQHRETSVSWSKSTQPLDTTAVFSYAPVGSTAYVTAPITELNGNLQVMLINAPDGQYNYFVRYYNGAQLVREASGSFVSAASSYVSESLTFATGSSGAAPDQFAQVNTFSYDAAGRLAASTDAEGYGESYTYDAAGNKLTFTNKKGATWTYAYDAAHRLTSEVAPAVDVTSVDPGTLAPTTTRVGVETRTGYDAVGNVTSRVEAYGRPEARTTLYQYDALGRQVRTVFPLVGVYGNDDLTTNGITGTVNRTETAVAPETNVTFDALGNAVVNRDAAGNYSYKIYDALGRVRYEIDAERYVTEYGYDAFGNRLTTTRYSTALDFGAVTGYAAHADGAAFGAAEIAARLATGGSDRVITTQYDALNRSMKVTEPAAYTYDSSAPAGSPQYFTVGRTTRNTYDAFGQAVKQSLLKNPGADLAVGSADDTWADTYLYYDVRGNKVAQVDALGYLTTWQYDERGDVVREVQYAKALTAGTWSAAGYAAAVATTPQSSPASPIGYDRETTYQYDRKSQKIAETKVNVEYGTLSGTLGLGTTTGNLTTSYGYDGVGNVTSVTDPTGATTYTYYDALGHAVANAAPARLSDTASGSVVMPPVYVSYSSSGNAASLSFARSAPTDTIVGLRYQAAGASTWTTPALQVQGGSYTVNLAGLPSDRYQYEITYTRTGDTAAYATGSGAFSLVGPSSVASTNVTAVVEQPSFSFGVAAGAYVSQTQTSEYGYDYSFSSYNQVNLGWSSLESLGSGNVRVRVNYLTYRFDASTDEYGHVTTMTTSSAGVWTYRDIVYSAPAAATGVTFAWNDTNLDGWNPTVYGGIQAIGSIQVYKVVDGTEVNVINSASGYTQSDRLLVRGKTAGLTGINVAGVGTLAATALGGGVYVVSLAGLSRGSYSFTPVGTASAVGGTFDVTHSGAAGNAGVQEFNATSNGRTLVAYNIPSGAASAVLQYRLAGDTGPYLSKTLAAAGAGQFSVSYDDVANGSYEYVLTVRDGAGNPVNLAAAGGTTAGTLSGTIRIKRGGDLATVATNANALTLTPLSVTRYDAFGDAVQEIAYAKGAVGADASAYGVPTSDPADQVTTNFYDSHGNVVRTVDPEGASSYRSYDALGRVAKTWQPVTDNDGLVNNAVQVFQYDKVGHQTATIESSYKPNETLLTSGAPRADALAISWSVAGSSGYYPQYDEYNNFTGWQFYGWNGLNLGWNDMSALGKGDIYVRIWYYTGLGNLTYQDKQLGYTATYAGWSWFDPGYWNTDGGVSSISSAQIWKMDASGTWRTMYNTSAQGPKGNDVSFAVPQQPGTGAAFKYTPQGQSTWSTATMYNMGDRYMLDTTGLNGSYNYEILYTRPGESTPYTHSQGTMTVSSSVATGVGVGNSTATTYTPAPLDPASYVSTQAQYNAFGEIASKGQNNGAQEYYQYDNAGHLWRTNDKTGVDRVYLYDVQGKSTAEIESQTLDLKNGYASASQVAALAGAVQRTDTAYDLLERVTKQVQPTFYVDRTMDAIASVATIPQVYLNFGIAQNGTVWYVDEYGQRWYDTVLGVSWNDMSGWGGGNTLVRVYYTPSVYQYADEYGQHYTYGAQTYRDFQYGAGTTSANPSWNGDGIWSLDAVQIFKPDAAGNWVLISSQGGSGASGNVVVWQTPTLVGAQVAFKYKATSATNWSTGAVTNFGASEEFDARGLAAGTYNYEIQYTRPGDAAPYAHKTGTFTVGAGAGITDTTQTGVTLDPITPTVTQTLDRWGNSLSVTDARGYTTDYRYNQSDKLVEEKKPTVDVWGANGANAPSRPVTRNYYDKAGRGLGTVDANGNATAARYDAAGQMTAEYHADGGVVSYQYDALGRRTRTIDALGNVTNDFYDHDDRLVRETHPIGEDNYAYDQAGNRIRVTNAMGEVTKYWYDTRNKVIRTRLPGGQETNDYYDARGNKIREVTANNDQPTWTYDYFGRLLAHTDMGGAVSTVAYDKAGHTSQQTVTRAGSTYTTTYSYYENGQLKRINDPAVGSETFYEYDASGNRTRERFTKGTVVYQDDRITYDALNRVGTLKDNRIQLTTYKYDAVGNRRAVTSDYYDGGNTLRHLESWYLYDSMNRITLSQGVLNAGVVQINGSQGVQLQYDAAGNRRVATSNQGGTPVSESYNYDANNRLTTTNRGGALTSSRGYDLAGRVTEDISYSSPGVINTRRVNSYFTTLGFVGKLYQQLVYNSAGSMTQATTYTGYDGMGNTQSYQISVYQGTGYTNYYSYVYAKYDGYKEKNVNGSSSYFQAGSTTTTYDFNGNIVSVSDQFAANRFRSFVTDRQGKILQKTENGSTQYYFYANDKPIGSSGALSAADFDYNYTPVSAQYPGSTPGSYVVSQGDTLRSIALAVFGDAQLWYLIADANGLRSDSDLKVGQQLTVPNKISNLHNDYKTFKVYAPGEIIGDTTPTLPDPPPPPPPPHHGKGGCGGLGLILIIIVAIVVTVFTAGAGAILLAGEVGLSSVSMSIIAEVGMSVLAGGAGLAGIGIAAAAAALGSIASQGVAMATGMQDKFSWRQVGMAAIGGGVTAGVGAAAGATGAFGNSLGGAMMQSATSNVITQGLEIVTGYQDKFDWRSVAVSAVSVPISAGIKQGLEGSGYNKAVGYWGSRFTNNMATGVATQFVRKEVYNGGKLDYSQIAADAFGNMIGNSIGESSARAAAGQQSAVLQASEAAARVLVADSGSTMSDAASPYGDVRFGDPVGRTAYSDAMLDALVQGMQNAGSPAGRPIALDDFGNPVSPNLVTGEVVMGADGTRGLRATDAARGMIADALDRVRTMDVKKIYDPNDPHQYVIFVADDGTRNDANQTLPTNPRSLYQLAAAADNDHIKPIYVSGVGTEHDLGGLNSALGLGAPVQVNQTMTAITDNVNAIMQADPDAKIVFVGTSFSRGSGTWRAVQNILAEQGIPDQSSPYTTVDDGAGTRVVHSRNLIEPGAVNIGASVIYDTVPTGMGNLYNMAIPTQAQQTLHLGALNEYRTAFPFTSALNADGSSNSPVEEMWIPGAHTNIGGGSYDRNGIGAATLEIGYTYLQRAGVPLALLADNLRPDPAQFVIHDSRWVRDVPFQQLVNDPNAQRTIRYHQ